MAHLNRKRNVNDEWIHSTFVNHASRDVEVDIYCSDFRLRVNFPYHREATLGVVHLIVIAEYLWRPGAQVELSFDHATQTFEYLEATRG
ncbi:hypothetical protein [Pseudomonas phage Achelous]|uniref:Uncharacterized protein n=1 Tax=Pseudomonas phage Achelous TaxID=2163982 RepID=A0A2S1GMT0_9CAUD|nr:hypothetical protein HOT10_gp25 [Pseudomonas phage Achelous]AWD90702.1 hypothetical protein [Pseudomonas phage Achelous]